MKAFYALLLACTLLSCKTYQVYQTKPMSDIKEENGYYVFENDTVKITYSFWAENGTLSYTFYNKLNIPIYIDWKKCSFIKSGQKLDYWADEENSNTVSKTKKYNSNLFYGDYDLMSGSYTRSNTTTVKPERVIFIAPNSSITRVQFVLYTDSKKVNAPSVSIDLKNPQTEKDVQVKSTDYTLQNSPIIFRNFISISTTENFEKEVYIDNGFYVYNTKEIKKSDFEGKKLYNNSTKKIEFSQPFANPKFFYTIKSNSNNYNNY